MTAVFGTPLGDGLVVALELDAARRLIADEDVAIGDVVVVESDDTLYRGELEANVTGYYVRLASPVHGERVRVRAVRDLRAAP